MNKMAFFPLCAYPAGVLFDIFIQTPSLVMAEFAGCIRCMFMAVMIGGLIPIVAGAVGLYVTRLERRRPVRWSKLAEHLIEVQP
jgi:hypothetical protein